MYPHFVCIMHMVIILTMGNHHTHVCNVHPYISLKNLGKKLCITHGKIVRLRAGSHHKPSGRTFLKCWGQRKGRETTSSISRNLFFKSEEDRSLPGEQKRENLSLVECSTRNSRESHSRWNKSTLNRNSNSHKELETVLMDFKFMRMQLIIKRGWEEQYTGAKCLLLKLS